MGQGRDTGPGELYAAYFRAWRDKSNQPAEPGQAGSDVTHNVIALSDIPAFVDIVPILVNDEVESAFWTGLPAQIDSLHRKGVKVARTIFLSALYEDGHLDKELPSPLTPFEDSPAGYRQRAREIEEKYCAGFGYDGIVIDVDRWLEGAELRRAAGVFRELAGSWGPLSGAQAGGPGHPGQSNPSQRLGHPAPSPASGPDQGQDPGRPNTSLNQDSDPASGPRQGRGPHQDSGPKPQQDPSSRLLIFDYDILMQPRDLGQAGALLPLVADCISYLFVDSYGLDLSRVAGMWEQARPFVRPDQFVPGFSFYEERGERWGDVPADGLLLESSRAWQLADWEPTGPVPDKLTQEKLSQQDERDDARKGGVFAYAIDRDGVGEGDDALRPTDFAVSRQIKAHISTSGS